MPVADNDNAVGRRKGLAAQELGLKLACHYGGRWVQHVGSWIMLGMLEALKLYARAERHRRGSVDPTALRVALDAVAIALSLGQRCVEGVRRLQTPSAATLLRDVAAPSASWTRRVLSRFARTGGVFLQLGVVDVKEVAAVRAAVRRPVACAGQHQLVHVELDDALVDQRASLLTGRIANE